jgi:ligand-binding SRPBCC domain-containing protein
MADYVLERRLWIPRPRPEVFAFFADARRLALADSPRARPRWLSPPSAPLSVGAVIDFRTRTAGLPIHWRLLVREWDPPHRFVDAQLMGPFARWEHRHAFREGTETESRLGPVGTWVEDRVTYRLPLGALGRLAHAITVRRRIAAILDERDLRAAADAPPMPASLPPRLS